MAKNRYTLITLSFLLFFLFTIFLFTKRSLEPSLSLYRDFFPQISIFLSTSDSNQPLPPISQSQPLDSKLGTVSVHDENNGTISASELDAVIASPFPFNESIGSNADAESVDAEKKEGESIVSDELIENGKKCDLYRGTWVKDESYPIYEPGSCPYVDEAFDCQINGRQDSDYLKWRWKPDGCDLPRFNARDFLERLRGKRLMLVGDSMNRNEFESMLCMLRVGLRDKDKMYEIYGHKITKGRGYYVFKFVDYNCSVEFVRSHFLVREGVRTNGQGNSNPTLSIDRIDKSSGRWKRADILVFNTGHWWVHGKTARGKNYYKEGDYLYPKFDSVEAYRRALKTWGKWIDENIDPAKQLVFYCGYSSAHFRRLPDIFDKVVRISFSVDSRAIRRLQPAFCRSVF